MRQRRRPRQIALPFRAHGGARPGAGRKPIGEKPGVPHRTRTPRTEREPALVTMKVRRGLSSLRGQRAFGRILEALVPASERLGARVIHYSVQRDHLHLVVEARTTTSLSRAIQGLAVRIARKLNRMMGRRGTVFADRFHDRVLATPRQVRNALAYVLCNARKHGVAPSIRGWLDPFSSASLFDGWSGARIPRERDLAELTVASPRTWLLRVGWRRAGLLDRDHRPGRSKGECLIGSDRGDLRVD